MRAVGDAAAVIGRTVDWRLLALVTGLASAPVADGLRAALVHFLPGDAAALDRLARDTATRAPPGFRVVTTLAHGLQAFVEGRFDTAADLLLTTERRSVALSGSPAQREIVQDTALHALIGAQRLDEAREVIHRRLDRRLSRRDLCLLGQLPGRGATARPPGVCVSG